MLDTPVVTTARSIKSLLQKLEAESLISLGQYFYHTVLLKDSGSNFIRKRINNKILKLVPDLATSADTYETHLVDWLKQWLKPGDTFWDVGANWGLISLTAAEIVGSQGQIITIEPSKASVAWINRHIALNQCANIVTVIEAAVCAHHGGSITFNLLNDSHSPCNSIMFSKSTNGEAPQINQQMSVSAISLDGLLAEQKKIPNIVKIDVEGAELHVLRGANQILHLEAAPILLLAVHPFWQENLQDNQEIISILKDAGYRILNRSAYEVEILEYDEYLCLPPHV